MGRFRASTARQIIPLKNDTGTPVAGPWATGQPSLGASGVTSGTYGNSTHVAVVTISDEGIITNVTEVQISGNITSTNVSANFTTAPAYNTYYVDTAGGPITATLNATPAQDEVVEIWDSTGHAATNPISLNGNGKNIAGAATVSNAVQVNYGMIHLQYNGTQWLAR